MIAVISFTLLQEPMIDSAGNRRGALETFRVQQKKNVGNSRSLPQSRFEWALIFRIEAVSLNWRECGP